MVNEKLENKLYQKTYNNQQLVTARAYTLLCISGVT